MMGERITSLEGMSRQQLDHLIWGFVRDAQGLSFSLPIGGSDRNILMGFVRYLLDPLLPKEEAYPLLIDYLDWFGKRYVLPKIYEWIPPIYTSAVELGLGSGWLLGGLVEKGLFKRGALGIDKRDFVKEDYLYTLAMEFFDVEKSPNRLRGLCDEISSWEGHTIIIANQFLHCVDNVQLLINVLRNYAWLVIETDPASPVFPYWNEQMSLRGANPIPENALDSFFGLERYECLSRIELPGQYAKIWVPSR